MLIDDNKIDLFINQRVIEKYDPNIEITTFSDAFSALNFFEGFKNCCSHTRTPQIILLDINMPGMTGFGFFNEFKRMQSAVGHEISIFMLSSSSSPDDLLRAENEPFCAGFIIKPLNVEKLKNALNHLENVRFPENFKKIV